MELFKRLFGDCVYVVCHNPKNTVLELSKKHSIAASLNEGVFPYIFTVGGYVRKKYG